MLAILLSTDISAPYFLSSKNDDLGEGVSVFFDKEQPFLPLFVQIVTAAVVIVASVSNRAAVLNIWSIGSLSLYGYTQGETR